MQAKSPKESKKEISQTSELSDKNHELIKLANSYISDKYSIIPCKDKKPDESRVKSVSKLRLNPIHHLNSEYYFSYSEQIAILTGNQLEAIDVDCKNDLTGKLWFYLLSAIKFSLPDVYDKIIIVSTPSKGYHIYYKCFQIGGNDKFARRPATPAELAKGERFKVLIETRGEGGYIIAPGSPGYELVKGDLSEIGYITPEERRELIAICKSFDQIAEPELKGITAGQKRIDNAPWNVFNSTHTYEWIIEQLTTAGWQIVKEEEDRITVLRPGSNSKSSGTVWIESGILYVFSTSAEFDSEKPYSAFGVLCQLKYDGDVRACAKDLAEQGIGTWNYEDGEFYCLDNKGKPSIKYSEILEWMKAIGLLKYRISAHEYYIVQVVGNIVKISDNDRIKKIFGDYIKGSVEEKIYNHFLPRLSGIFNKEGLLTQLEDIDEKKFIQCDDKTGWLFYSNAAIKVTSADIFFVEYTSLDGYVWEKNIVQRIFKLSEKSGDYSEFINLTASQKPEILLRFECALGYLLHNYKDPTNPKVIIFNDEFFNEDGDEPQGGTGKGLIIKGVSHITTTHSIDGKNFNINRSFAFSGLNPDTRILAIEDVLKVFDFEKFFSLITEGFVVEKKGKDEFTIPFDKSPKILITTNYAIKGSSSSHLRRRYELEVSPFFSHKFRPIDYFKKRFFVDWDAEEWSHFDNYMASCLQSFLQSGLPDQLTVNLEKKKLIQETNIDFVKWMDSLAKNNEVPSGRISKEEFMRKFTSMYPDFAVKLTQSKFTRWLLRWCEGNNVSVDTRNVYNGVMVYSFKTKAADQAEDAELKALLYSEDCKSAENSGGSSTKVHGGWQPDNELEAF